MDKSNLEEDLIPKESKDWELQSKTKKPEFDKDTEKNQLMSLFYAGIAGVIFSIANYIYGSYSVLGWVTRENVAFGALVYAIARYLFLYIQAKRKNTIFWQWSNSNFRNKNTNKFCWLRFSGALAYSIILLISGTLLLYTFKFAIYGNINQGIITSLFGLSSVFSAVLAYFIFGDFPNIFHGIGMFLMIVCIVGLSLGSTKNLEVNDPILTINNWIPFEDHEVEESDSISSLVYALLSIFLGIVSPISFSIMGMLIRYMSESYGFDNSDLTLIGLIWMNIILTPAMVITYIDQPESFTWTGLFSITLAGFIGAYGNLWLSKALVLGPAGPVFALANIQVIIQSILSAVFLFQIPSIIEIAAAIFGGLGCLIIALGPDIFKKMKAKQKQ